MHFETLQCFKKIRDINIELYIGILKENAFKLKHYLFHKFLFQLSLACFAIKGGVKNANIIIKTNT